MVTLGDDVTVSQQSHLCAAGHELHHVNSKDNGLIVAPITIESRAWVAADAFIGMGVTVGEGAVVGARAAVFKDVEPWTVVGGNPARFIKKRELQS
jgi:putative colanic acid biosynthesis acetyltransferase WcaF